MKEPNFIVRTRDEDGHLVEEKRAENTICEGWHNFLIRLANPEDRLTASGNADYELALGSGGSNGVAYTDTSLNTEEVRVEVVDFVDEGDRLICVGSLDSSEGNNVDLDEMGVVIVLDDGTELLANHAQISTITKNSGEQSTIEARLELANDTNDS